jgi:hypothetical protein
VLDVSKAEGIVDLSLRTELIEPLLVTARPTRGKRKAAADPATPAVCNTYSTLETAALLSWLCSTAGATAYAVQKPGAQAFE